LSGPNRALRSELRSPKAGPRNDCHDPKSTEGFYVGAWLTIPHGGHARLIERAGEAPRRRSDVANPFFVIHGVPLRDTWADHDVGGVSTRRRGELFSS